MTSRMISILKYKKSEGKDDCTSELSKRDVLKRWRLLLFQIIFSVFFYLSSQKMIQIFQILNLILMSLFI